MPFLDTGYEVKTMPKHKFTENYNKKNGRRKCNHWNSYENVLLRNYPLRFHTKP